VGYSPETTAVQNAYHPFVEAQTIIPETDLYTVYAEASFEVTDTVELFGEFLYNRRETYQNGWRQFWTFGYTGDLYGAGSPNGYNYWGAGWTVVNYISPTAITDHSDSSQTVDYYRGVAGLRGGFGGDSSWRWEAYTQYSRSVGRYRTEQILQDSYDTGYFQFGSCVGTVTPVSGKQCIDIPWLDPYFLAGDITPEQAAFLFGWEEGRTLYTQLTFEGSVSGDRFELPAGAVSAAFGATLRKDKIEDVPGEITGAGNAWGASTSGMTAGDSNTSECSADVPVPILADPRFGQVLTLAAGGRPTHVSATRESDGDTRKGNGNFTCELGLSGELNDWLRRRGSYGTSFRAPALFEHFL